MAYLLRALLLIMLLSILYTIALAHGYLLGEFSHIQIAIPAFIYTIFVQAFVMFFFIGVSRWIENIHLILQNSKDLNQLFEEPPEDLTPYMKQVNRFNYEAGLSKRQTIPWTILILILGMVAFLMGGAHDTMMVEKTTHSGIAYGFIFALIIGFFRQWYFLGRIHRLIRKTKTLFGISDDSM